MDFGSDDDTGAWCNDLLSKENTMGEVVGNSGPDDFKVTAVSIVGAEGLEIVASYFALVKTKTYIGYAAEWPPSKSSLVGSGIKMTDLMPAANAILTPNVGVDKWSLILHLRRPDLTKPAKYASVRIDYQVNGRSYFKKSSMRLELPCP